MDFTLSMHANLCSSRFSFANARNLLPLSQIFPDCINSTCPRQRHAVALFASTNVTKSDQLVHHRVACPLHQRVHVRGCQPRRGDCGQNRDVDNAGPYDPRLHVQHVAVVGRHNGHNGDLRLYCEMESALLERQQGGLASIAARALGEDEDGLAVVAHCACGAIEGCAGGGAVGTVDEDGLAERHELAQEGGVFEAGLGRHRAVLGEHAAEHEHVEFARCHTSQLQLHMSWRRERIQL